MAIITLRYCGYHADLRRVEGNAHVLFHFSKSFTRSYCVSEGMLMLVNKDTFFMLL